MRSWPQQPDAPASAWSTDTSPKRQRVHSRGDQPLTRWRFGLVSSVSALPAFSGEFPPAGLFGISDKACSGLTIVASFCVFRVRVTSAAGFVRSVDFVCVTSLRLFGTINKACSGLTIVASFCVFRVRVTSAVGFVSQLDTSAPRFRRRSVAKRANSEPGVRPKCQVARGRILPVRDDPRFMVDLTSQRTKDQGQRTKSLRTPNAVSSLRHSYYRNFRGSAASGSRGFRDRQDAVDPSTTNTPGERRSRWTRSDQPPRYHGVMGQDRSGVGKTIVPQAGWIRAADRSEHDPSREPDIQDHKMSRGS